MTTEQIEEVERLLSYYESHGAMPFWTEDVVKLLRDVLPEWSAFKAADSSAETYPAVSVRDGKVHRPANMTHERMDWFRPMLTACGRTVTPLNVYESVTAATGGRAGRLCAQCGES